MTDTYLVKPAWTCLVRYLLRAAQIIEKQQIKVKHHYIVFVCFEDFVR